MFFIFSDLKENMSLNVIRVHLDAKLPTRGTEEAAGYDLYSCIDIALIPHAVTKVALGIKMEIPKGTYGKLFDRSSMATRGILTVGGVIDSDYRGEVAVLLYNTTSSPFIVNKGDRIAQMVIHNISTPPVLEVKEISSTARNEGGFGSTGI